MKVVTAKTAGFCFGVQRAVDKVYELISQNVAPIYTLDRSSIMRVWWKTWRKKEFQVIQEDQLETIQEGTVVIRSHGVGKNVYDRIKAQGLDYVDATCPFVLKIHRIVERESLAGNHRS